MRCRDSEVGKRLLAHVENGTTDQADAVMRVPASEYLDPERHAREVSILFERLPLMLGFTAELREPGQYKALDVVGIPVILIRSRDGQVRAFLNVCSHRGSRLLAAGEGRCRNIVCPYHAWAFDDRGRLSGIFKAELFGEVDRESLGLTELPCEEFAGLVFAVLTPGVPLDLAEYLGGMADELRALGMHEWHVYARRELTSSNWKIAHDGYVDGYHLEVLHPNSVGLVSKGAVNTFDAFGPHQKIGFASHEIEKLRECPPEEWRQDDGFSFVRTLFPNTSLAVTDRGGLVSQLFPGQSADQSHTLQTFLRQNPPADERERHRADAEVEVFYAAVRDEDYTTVDGIQRGLESGAIDEVVFGRNELGNQRWHQWVARYLEENSS